MLALVNVVNGDKVGLNDLKWQLLSESFNTDVVLVSETYWREGYHKPASNYVCIAHMDAHSTGRGITGGVAFYIRAALAPLVSLAKINERCGYIWLHWRRHLRIYVAYTYRINNRHFGSHRVSLLPMS